MSYVKLNFRLGWNYVYKPKCQPKTNHSSNSSHSIYNLRSIVRMYIIPWPYSLLWASIYEDEDSEELSTRHTLSAWHNRTQGLGKIIKSTFRKVCMKEIVDKTSVWKFILRSRFILHLHFSPSSPHISRIFCLIIIQNADFVVIISQRDVWGEGGAGC